MHVLRAQAIPELTTPDLQTMRAYEQAALKPIALKIQVKCNGS